MSAEEMRPEVFTVDYIGEPGHRVFYLQGRAGGTARTFLVEKQQVTVLAERLRELLLLVDERDTVKGAGAARDPALALEDPADPEWRVGAMGLAYDDDEDRVVLFVSPVEAEEELVEEEDDEGLRFVLRRDQVRGFVLHAFAVVAEGRQICPLCGLPMDPAGHRCPASNGHHLDV